jgi:hypothetical protein
MRQPPQRPTRRGTVGVAGPDSADYLGERPAVPPAGPREAEAVAGGTVPGRAPADALAGLARAPHTGDAPGRAGVIRRRERSRAHVAAALGAKGRA